MKQNIKSLLFNLLTVYFLYTICRIVFFVFNFSYFGAFNTLSLFKALLIGIRFDTVAIIYTNSLFILLSLIPNPYRTHLLYMRFLKSLFVIVNTIALVFNLVDCGYFQFSGKRSGIEIFGIKKDILDQAGVYIFDYWYFILFIGMVAFGLAKLYRNPTALKYSFKIIFQEISLFIIAMGLCVAGARNSFALKPLNTLDASRLTQSELSALVLNTPFQLIMTVQQTGLSEKTYMSPEKALHYFNPIHQYKTNKSEGKNIVLLIVESLGKEYVGFYNNGNGYTPFLDSLMQHSIVFDNAYANGKRSIEGIPSIIASMPSLMDNDYMNSYYQSNSLQSAGSYLQKKGYDVSFYHGGKNGTMSFDNFIANTHAGNYFGLNEYPNPTDFDGNWGIFDDAYLQYFSAQITAMPQPFFTTVFTLSSHHPYTIPTGKESWFKNGTLPIHKSIRFTDYALQQFFEAAKQTSWYKNTVFIITADHSSINEQPKYASIEGMYRIPLCIFNPEQQQPQRITKTTQQLDILPMVLKYGNYNQPYFSFGNSFDTTNQTNGYAIQYINKMYQFIQYPYVLHFDGEHAIGLYTLATNDEMVPTVNDEQKGKMELLLKAILQQYTFDLIHNKTAIPN